MRNVLAIVFFLCLSCASASVPVARGSVDWAGIDDEWSILVVTVDSDGDERVTRIWIAAEEDVAFIRTGDSRWWRNLERDPTIRIRRSGADQAFRVEIVAHAPAKVEIDTRFLEKYGAWERVLFPQSRGETHENYARLLR